MQDINISDFYIRLGTLVIILVLGFILGKLKIINKESNKSIVNLLLLVFMPAALFNAFPKEFSDDKLQLFISGAVGGAVVMLLLIIVSKIIFNKSLYKNKLQDESQFAFIFNNATFLGYPIIATTFGEAGLVPYSGFIIAFNLALFSYGIWLFEKKFSFKFLLRTITNPNIIATALGLAFFLLHINPPQPIADAVTFTASAMTPMSLIVIGYMLSNAKLLKILKKWRIFLTAAIQLIIGPTITFFALSLPEILGLPFTFPREVIVVCTIIQALPTATSLGLFAEKYGGNATEASELVTISTILSIVSLPLMITLLLG